MVDVLKVIKGELDPDITLREAWCLFSDNLVEAGSGPDQLNAMQSAYFMGAAQAFMSIDRAAKLGAAELTEVMNQMFKDVDEEMRRNHKMLHTEGNA